MDTEKLLKIKAMVQKPLTKRKQAWAFIHAVQEGLPNIVDELIELRKQRASKITDERLRSIMDTATPQSIIGQLVSEIRRLSA